MRHYHDVGLLEEPRRRTNGYKQYGVAHLVRVLRITRLADLGLTLPQSPSWATRTSTPARRSASSTPTSPGPSTGCRASAPRSAGSSGRPRPPICRPRWPRGSPAPTCPPPTAPCWSS
ncbi:MAG: MerR family transcriptional regulator [Pseudonocardiales bacterium]|nr:MerR family transcriptional regulator [Pseudonocardiales bacterium]